MAVPFVQGRIVGVALAGAIATHCAHCGRSLHITVDSELQFSVVEAGAQPLVLEPHVVFATLSAPNILDAY